MHSPLHLVFCIVLFGVMYRKLRLVGCFRLHLTSRACFFPHPKGGGADDGAGEDSERLRLARSVKELHELIRHKQRDIQVRHKQYESLLD